MNFARVSSRTRCLRPGALYREGICFCFSSVGGLCQGTTSVVPQLKAKAFGCHPEPSSDVLCPK